MKKFWKIALGTALGVASLVGVASAAIVSSANLYTYQSSAEGSPYYYGPGYVYEDASVSTGSGTGMNAKVMKVIEYWPDSAIDTVTVTSGNPVYGRYVSLPSNTNQYYIRLEQNSNYGKADGTGYHYR
ncbi:hypothetical protein [Effusibacillus consociatus]|uniref:Uncharacterized protein n=1 Tax=Effusibacillus consociatus TaxID=1117041 RepID=A0ABV9Q5T4_9BACL